MDYCEIILDSVHKIVTAEMAKEKLNKDNLTLAQILQDNGIGKETHSFLVQESGGRRFEAYMTIGQFELHINDYVFLSGNNIIAKKLDSSQMPIAVNESLKDFIAFEKKSLKSKENYYLSDSREYNRLLIEATVTSADIDNHNYLINIQLTNEAGRTYSFNFSERDLVGQTKYLASTLQKQMYELNIGIITQAYITYDNLTYNSVTVSFGNNAENLSEEMGLKLKVAREELLYQTSIKGIVSSDSYEPSWTWIYIDENDFLRKVTEDKTVNYYRYNENYNTGDEYGGLNWEPITLSSGKITQNNFLPNSDSTIIKAVLSNGQEIVTSNELVFKNIKLDREGIISNLTIGFSDGRNGAYPLYTPTGELLGKFAGSELTKERELKVSYVNVDETVKVNNLVESITWTVDIDKIELLDQSDAIVNAKKDTYGNLITTFTINRPDESEWTDWDTLKYRIKKSISLVSGSNDMIKCSIKLAGEEDPYEASAFFKFSTELVGNGDYSLEFVLKEKVSNEVCYSADVDKDYKLLCNIWDRDGKEVDYTKFQITNIAWYGYRASGDVRAFDLRKNTNDIVLTKTGDSRKNWTKTSHIIQVTIQITNEEDDSKKQLVKTLYPLAVHSADFNLVYNGPTQFVYDTTGILSGSGLAKQEVSFSSMEDFSLSTWQCRYLSNLVAPNIEIKEDMAGSGEWHPALIKTGEKYYLIAPNCYDSTITDKGKDKYLFNLVVIDESNNHFSQPIVIYQNTQFSQYIDHWGGELTIDGDKNSILAAAVVAGKKNADNKFSGVVIGDIGTIADGGTPNATTSGILGFQDGAEAFGFKNDGSAFIGKSGSGRITFDGNEGYIQSGDFEYENATEKKYSKMGMRIDLNEFDGADISSGGIHAKNFALMPNGTVYIRNADLGGQKIENNYWIDANREGRINYIKSGHVPNNLDEGVTGYIYQHNMAGINELPVGTYTVTVNANLLDDKTQLQVFVGGPEGYYKTLLLESEQPPFLKAGNGIQHFYFELTEQVKKNSSALTVNFNRDSESGATGNGGIINWVMLTHNTSQYNELLFPAKYDTDINQNLLSTTDAFKTQQNASTSAVLGKYLLRDQGLTSLINKITQNEHLTFSLRGDLNSNKITDLKFYFEDRNDDDTIRSSWEPPDWVKNKMFGHIWNSEYYIFDLPLVTVGDRNDIKNWLTSRDRKNIYFIVHQMKGNSGYTGRVALINAAKLELGPCPTHIDPSMDVVDDWSYIPPEKDETTITGGRIDTYLINANKISVDSIKSSNLAGYAKEKKFTDAGMYIDLHDGYIHAPGFYIDGKEGNAHFKGVIEAETGGKIAGWEIGSNKLITKDYSLGKENSFHLYNKGTTPNVSIGGSGNKNNWRLAIGTNFGVDADGAVYARAGRIGGFDIIDGQLKLSPGGTNFLLKSHTSRTSSGYFLTKYYVDSIINTDETIDLPTNPDGVKYFHLIPGTKYTMQIDITIEKTTDLDTNYIGLYCGDGNAPLSYSGYGPKAGDDTQVVKGNGSWFKLSKNNGRFIFEFPFTVYKNLDLSISKQNRWPIYLYQRNDMANTSQNKIVIHRIKVEEGIIATNWSLAPGDNASIEQYSELKIENEHMVAKVQDNSGDGCGWDLTQDAFSVHTYKNGEKKDDGITVNENGLEVKGKIEATSGSIGPVILSTGGLGSYDNQGDNGYALILLCEKGLLTGFIIEQSDWEQISDLARYTATLHGFDPYQLNSMIQYDFNFKAGGKVKAGPYKNRTWDSLSINSAAISCCYYENLFEDADITVDKEKITF